MNLPLTSKIVTPPLQNGDRLTRAEFERRYEAMPEIGKAELIDGVVYMPSPVSQLYHSNPHFNFIGWLAAYVAGTPGTQGGDNGSLKLDLKNEPQPDAFLILLPECGGRVRFDADGYVVGAPELVGEIAASSISYDLHDKLQTYRKNGVQEYLVWRVLEQTIDWFVLKGTDYEPLAPFSEGLYQSSIFPGLWLDTRALLAGNLLGVLQVVQQGLASPPHQAFVQELQRRGPSGGTTP
jgi:Uma2 family endonuclease